MSDPNLPEGVTQKDIDSQWEVNPLVVDDFIYGEDGNQITCFRPDFIDLQESHCGFGDTLEEAKADLIRQEGGVA